MDTGIGVAVIDRFTYYLLQYMEDVDLNSKKLFKSSVI